MDGQQIAGIPFPVFVSISPTRLDKPVKVWAGIDCPTGITINSEGDIIVTECYGDIVKLDKEKKKCVLVEHSQCTLKNLAGIATDDEDNVYCTDYATNKILRFDKNGGNIQVHEVEQVKGPGHWGVALVGDEVMVCERYNNGTIMVYSRELKYVRRIQHGNTGEFRGVSADSHGNLYVTDYTNWYIRVFNNDGVFLHSFGSDGGGMKRLALPYGVCVSGQYVYVTNSLRHNVSVFTTAGDYLMSFGQRGKGEGDFIFPIYLCIDADGFLFVADHNNHRVQSF